MVLVSWSPRAADNPGNVEVAAQEMACLNWREYQTPRTPPYFLRYGK